MKIILRHRQFGKHTFDKETEVPGGFADYATPKPGSRPDEFVIDEDKLIAALPNGWLPVPPARVLLAVEDDLGGTGQVDLSRFLDWAKYFDAYCLNLVKPQTQPLPDEPGAAVTGS
jgi:hypothetical protein